MATDWKSVNAVKSKRKLGASDGNAETVTAYQQSQQGDADEPGNSDISDTQWKALVKKGLFREHFGRGGNSSNRCTINCILWYLYAGDWRGLPKEKYLNRNKDTIQKRKRLWTEDGTLEKIITCLKETGYDVKIKPGIKIRGEDLDENSKLLRFRELLLSNSLVLGNLHDLAIEAELLPKEADTQDGSGVVGEDNIENSKSQRFRTFLLSNPQVLGIPSDVAIEAKRLLEEVAKQDGSSV